MNLKIKPISSLYDLKKTHDIQRNTWGYRDEMIFPYTIMTSTRHSGGVLLGAYIDDNLVGFLYGYLGMGGGSLYLFSQRMGILPEYQGLGIGTALKLAQREQMLRQGIDLVVWTYEPLAGISARDIPARNTPTISRGIICFTKRHISHSHSCIANRSKALAAIHHTAAIRTVSAISLP
jgi:predicted GNAT superfamily acetyltransferase